MLGCARAGATEVPAHSTGEQLGGPFLAFGGRHRRLAGARQRGDWTDQGECSGFEMRWSGLLPRISPARSPLHDSTNFCVRRLVKSRPHPSSLHNGPQRRRRSGGAAIAAAESGNARGAASITHSQ